MKQLLFDPKVDRRLQLDEEWRAVAKSYLLDSRFTEGIQSLNLKDPQMLEKAVNFVKNPSSLQMRKNLCARAKGLMDDFDRYSTGSKSNEYTEMWLRMAVVIFQTVMGRKSTHPEDIRGLVNILHHYMIVTALLLEVLADWNSSPDSFLRKRYLSDIDDNSEGPPKSSDQKRKRGVEGQTDGNKTHAGPRDEIADEATGGVDGDPSMSGDETRVDHDLESQKVADIPDIATHHSYQQPAAPIAVMFVPSKQHQTTSPTAPTNAPEPGQATVTGIEQAEQTNGDPNDDSLGGAEQDETRSVQDLEGSTSDFVAEAEGTTTKGLRSMPHEEHTKREQTEQESKDERKKRKQAKKQAKHRTRELEQAEQKAKDKRKKNRLATKQAKNRIRELEKSEQIANDRIRELEQKLELQEASSSSGDGQAK